MRKEKCHILAAPELLKKTSFKPKCYVVLRWQQLREQLQQLKHPRLVAAIDCHCSAARWQDALLPHSWPPAVWKKGVSSEDRLGVEAVVLRRPCFASRRPSDRELRPIKQARVTNPWKHLTTTSTGRARCVQVRFRLNHGRPGARR